MPEYSQANNGVVPAGRSACDDCPVGSYSAWDCEDNLPLSVSSINRRHVLLIYQSPACFTDLSILAGELLALQEVPGRSIRDYARRKGVHYLPCREVFERWRKRMRCCLPCWLRTRLRSPLPKRMYRMWTWTLRRRYITVSGMLVWVLRRDSKALLRIMYRRPFRRSCSGDGVHRMRGWVSVRAAD